MLGAKKVKKITGNSILPARRTAITLHTGDGLDLVGEIAEPLDGPSVATMVCFHPLPTQGGMMDSHLLRKAAYRLPALANISVLRFNTRGTTSAQGTSEGSFDGGNDEKFDVAAAIEYAEFKEMKNIWLVGWSFGTDLILRHGLDPVVRGAILLSPPLRFSEPDDLANWNSSDKPLVALVPEFDEFLPAGPAKAAFADYPRVELVIGENAKHLWVGHTEYVLGEIVRRLAPQVQLPLPVEWDGPMEMADTSFYAR